ncbi:hypothetical protein ACQX72_14215, partial [Staphylococcus aureus]|uniref:hypothetical protein n=1 Tax=Staphylococcus aureus TaxID=1280 RepID=UPI003D1D131E
MDKNRLWVVGAVIVAVAIVAGGWFLGVQPQLAATAAAELERVQSDAQNATHQAELDKLKSDYADLDRLKSQLAALQTSIPEGSELPSFVDQLNALCGTSGVSFVGYTTAASQPYKAASPASGSSG